MSGDITLTYCLSRVKGGQQVTTVSMLCVTDIFPEDQQAKTSYMMMYTSLDKHYTVDVVLPMLQNFTCC